MSELLELKARPVPRIAALPALLLAAVLLGAGIALIIVERSMRVVEAQVAAWIFDATFAKTSVLSVAGGEPAVTFSKGADWYALRVRRNAPSRCMSVPF